MINLINEQNKQGDIDKIYLYAKDLREPKYEYLIKNHENTGIKHVNNSKAFAEIQWVMFMRILIVIIIAEKEKY